MLLESPRQFILAGSIGKAPPPAPMNGMGQHYGTSSGKLQCLFSGTVWIQITSCTPLARPGQDGRMPERIRKMMKLNGTDTTTLTLPKLPKGARKKKTTNIEEDFDP